MLVLWIALAGGAGSAARYLVSLMMVQLTGARWLPAGTMAVNIAGCFLVGLLAGMAEHRGALSQQTRTVITVGFLGGFTTFSAFGFETVTMARDGHAEAAMINIAVQVVAGLAAVLLGMALGQRL